ncbi:hypothetical protein, partial [Nocardia testacea]|uniref:hypothetical protein n=1 Tax=Nocardia testacea TaxID=248551 RepID=UPI000584C6DB
AGRATAGPGRPVGRARGSKPGVDARFRLAAEILRCPRRTVGPGSAEPGGQRRALATGRSSKQPRETADTVTVSG